MAEFAAEILKYTICMKKILHCNENNHYFFPKDPIDNTTALF